jgi:MFS family permease
MFVVAYGLFLLVAMRMHAIALLLFFVALAGACTSAAFVSVGPIVGAVAPYRMRTQAFALVPVFIFLVGGFFGGILAGALSGRATASAPPLRSWDPSPASSAAASSCTARFLKRDISMAVEELIERSRRSSG